MVPNSVVRVLADSNSGLAFLTLSYLQYLALQILPDTAESAFLDRFANIWLVDPRKPPFYSVGTVSVTATSGAIIPLGQQFVSGVGAGGPVFAATAQVTVGGSPCFVPVVAINPYSGVIGNLFPGTTLALSPAIPNVSETSTVVLLTGGADQETDDELRARVLLRIREPPCGGDATDYVEWALSVPGCTRAWVSPLEMGISTVTVRVMFDDLRSSNGGFPLPTDIKAVQTYLNSVRPVTVSDVYVVAPIPMPVNFTLTNLNATDSGTMANIAGSVSSMLKSVSAPASVLNGLPIPPTTIYSSWVNQSVLEAAGVSYFDLGMTDMVPASNGSLAVLGTITLG
jgi:uncharacterized phage protein gp47/JayE